MRESPLEMIPGQTGLARTAVCAALAILAFATAVPPAAAQTAPSALEIVAYTGLHSAAQKGDLAAIAALVKASPHAIGLMDTNRRTPLHVATFARQRTAVAALIAAGANTAALDKDQYDAVTIAAVADDEETLRVLLAHGASANWSPVATTAPHSSLRPTSATMAWCASCWPRAHQLDHVNNLHWTALIESIVLGDGGPRHQRTASALLGARANTQLTDRDGRTPLELARLRGYDAMERLLRNAEAR